jgi:asparagine synthase (glutamine-hydrolysing)
VTELSGWIDTIGTEAPDATLAALGAVDHGAATPVRFGQAGVHAALEVHGATDETWFGRDGPLTAAIAGRPRWLAPDLAHVAAERGHAAALIEAWRRWGEEAPRHLDGGFAAAIVDYERCAGLAAIDRAGIGRLCYATPRPGTIVFGTSADAVARHPSVGATVSNQAILDFLTFYAVPCPITIYAEQRKLRPAESIRLGGDSPRPRFYWRMPYGEATAGDARGLAEDLRAVLRGAIGRACRGRDPARLGAFLSGGLDSSSVAGFLAAATDGRARTFTIAFREPEYDESGFARIAARHFATDHHERTLTAEDAARLLPRLAEAYDEPFANTSAIPAFYCARMAGEAGVEIMLAGDGGDEIFAGNARYLEMLRMEGYGRLPAWLRRGLVEPAASALLFGDALPITGRARRRIRRLARPLPERMHSGLFDGALPAARVLAPDFLATVDPSHGAGIMREVWERTGSEDVVQRMLHHDIQVTLADNDLRKVTRMCALAGVGVAFPMLDAEVLEFSARVPPGLLMADGRLRAFYRDAMAGFLPREILEKKKHGFGMPYGLWLKEGRDFRAFCSDHVAEFARRGILRASFAKRIGRALGGAELDSSHVGVAIDVAILQAWLAARGL